MTISLDGNKFVIIFPDNFEKGKFVHLRNKVRFSERKILISIIITHIFIIFWPPNSNFIDFEIKEFFLKKKKFTKFLGVGFIKNLHRSLPEIDDLNFQRFFIIFIRNINHSNLIIIS